MTNTYCVILHDPVPKGLVEALERRFGDVRVTRGRRHTQVECQLEDEAALRGLLTAVWDAGLRVLALLEVAVAPAGVAR
jgi:hypothetical protein